MRTFNQVILVGHLGRDAEVKFTATGTSRATFSVATQRRVKGAQEGTWSEETDWHNCCMWRSENVAPYLLKGKGVIIKGRLQTRSWDKDGEKRYTTEVIVEELILAGEAAASKAVEDEAPALVSKPRRGAAAPEMELGITDDDVPF